MLKPVNKEKNPGLAKLPEKVRNRMGFAKKGKMTYAKSGTMSTKDDDKRDIRKVEEKIGASKSSRREMGRKKMIKARVGKMIDDVEELGRVDAEKARSKKGKRNLKSEKKRLVREIKVEKASMGKSVRGYGAARTSGMGLQDESLPPGKSLDYYKDLM